jgi:catechol 2,3-dioxygenase-like lactoylglutathione lyase family enzyme
MIEGIDAITYRTDQLTESNRFMRDWGLTEIAANHFETMNGSAVYLTDAVAADEIEPGATLHEVVWGVAEAADLAKLAGLLSANRGFQFSANEVHALDPHGLRLRFRLTQKRALNVQGSPSNPYGNTQRVNAPSPVYDRATPVEIGHVVLFTQLLDEAEQFYQNLGFTTSDRYPGRGIFMRCSPEGGHHDLFLLKIPNKPQGLNHVAFTVRDIHEVFGGGLHMSRCGWKTQLGPGRHPISSAYFWYFDNPAGGLIEYNADEDHLTEAWQARSFEPGPTVFAEWAVDGGIDGHTRRQPKIENSGAFLTERK